MGEKWNDAWRKCEMRVKFWSGNLKLKVLVGDLGIDGRII
jgi:hypothetical protein